MQVVLSSLVFFLACPVIVAGPIDLKLSVQERVTSRDFPSVFEAWSPADNLKNESRWATQARYDLAIQDPRSLGLRWNNRFPGSADGFSLDSIAEGRALRARLLKLNPHLILLAEIRYRDAPKGYLPSNSAWWLRKDGNLQLGWKEGGFLKLDFANSTFRAQVAMQARAAMSTAVFDGVFFDWWQEDDDRLALIKTVRAAIGEQALIVANTNEHIAPRTAPYFNGCYMECTRSSTAKDWQKIASTLRWAEANLREPRVNCVETWFHQSRQDLNLMRATTTLALTMSDGYCLFCDPDSLPTPDHLHDWYDFWNKSLGKPSAPGKVRSDGAWQREFSSGSAVYNPIGNGSVTVVFDEPRLRRSTGENGTHFTLANCDGDLFLTQSHPSLRRQRPSID